MDKTTTVQELIDIHADRIGEAYEGLFQAYNEFYEELVGAEAVNFAAVLLHQRNLISATEKALLDTCLELVAIASGKTIEGRIDDDSSIN